MVSSAATADTRWRNVSIVGGTVVTVVIVVILAVVNLRKAPEEPRLNGEGAFQGIQGGLTEEVFP